MTEQDAGQILSAARGLLARIDASGCGIYYRPTEEDLPIVTGVMRVCAAYSGPDNEWKLDLLLKEAGFRPSDWGLVVGMVQQYTLGLPGVAERRIEALRHFFAEAVEAREERES